MDKKLLFTDGIDACVILSSVNRQYFTGLATSFGCAVITEKDDFFVTDFRYQTDAKDKLQDFNLYFVNPAGLMPKIAEICASVGARKIGFEENLVTVQDYQALSGVLKDCILVPCGGIINSIRLIKTEDEIAKIQQAQAITERALTETLRIVKPKVSERDVNAELVYNMYAGGADGLAFDNIVAFGANSAKPHSKPGDRKLEKDDVMLFDLGVRFKGYCSDMSRTFALSEPTPKLRSIYKIVLDAQEYALKFIKAGITCAEADSYAREHIIAHGYGKDFGHSLGHGVGLEIHETPRLAAGSDVILRENMVVTVEPGIYLESIGGVRIEDMVVIKKDGIVNLTSYKKELII
ncbi:MAG: Xaa-Pro peptidase family protein [Clostridiales bacterium]|jgi:Xaa-Pro aminopeptidase|nr:Xaa-Pro peptidase family protein [Clostridiales bacterium]